MSKKAIDTILREQGFYPFSLKYNLKKAHKKHQLELESLVFDDTAKAVLEHSHHFHKYFIAICDALKVAIDNSKLEKPEFIALLLADLNRTEVIVTEEVNLALKATESFDMNQISDVAISKPEFQNESESAWSLIDSAIDTTIINLNYLNFVSFEQVEKITEELDQVDVIINLTLIGSIFNAAKQAYDRIIWRGYSMEFENDELRLKADPNDLMLDNAGLTRLARNIAGKFNELENNHVDHKNILNYYHETRKFQEINSIETSDTGLRVKYKKKRNKTSSSYCLMVAPLLTYYPFYRSQEIAALSNLTILDLVNLFSTLQDFVRLLPMPKYDDTAVKDLTQFHRFNPAVKKTTLLAHFKTITK